MLKMPIDPIHLKDYVFSVGCFDTFHEGHVKLLGNMRLHGRKLIIGIHDDRSIELLKRLSPVDGLEKRLEVSYF